VFYTLVKGLAEGILRVYPRCAEEVIVLHFEYCLVIRVLRLPSYPILPQELVIIEFILFLIDLDLLEVLLCKGMSNPCL
jgi:hypothetical protein